MDELDKYYAKERSELQKEICAYVEFNKVELIEIENRIGYDTGGREGGLLMKWYKVSDTHKKQRKL